MTVSATERLAPTWWMFLLSGSQLMEKQQIRAGLSNPGTMGSTCRPECLTDNLCHKCWSCPERWWHFRDRGCPCPRRPSSLHAFWALPPLVNFIVQQRGHALVLQLPFPSPSPFEVSKGKYQTQSDPENTWLIQSHWWSKRSKQGGMPHYLVSSKYII